MVNTYSDYSRYSWLPHFIPPGKCGFCTGPSCVSFRPSYGIHTASSCSVWVSVQCSQCHNRRHRCHWTSMADTRRRRLRGICLCRSYLYRTECICRFSCTPERRYTPTSDDSRRMTCRLIQLQQLTSVTPYVIDQMLWFCDWRVSMPALFLIMFFHTSYPFVFRPICFFVQLYIYD